MKKSNRQTPTPEMLARIEKAIEEEEKPEVVDANKARGRQVFLENDAAELSGISQRILALLRQRKLSQSLSL